MVPLLWRALALVLLLVLLPSGRPPVLAGQSVSGRVLDGGSGLPVAGAIVEALSPDSVRVRVTLSRDDGRYDLRLPGPGDYLLRAGAMGYATLLVGPVALRGGETRDMRLDPAPVQLEGISTSAEDGCGAATGGGGDTGRLWTQIRKALEVTDIAQTQGLYELELLRFERGLEPSGDYLAYESRELWEGTQPFRGVPLDTVLRRGFIADRRGTLEYYVPTPSIILSDGFLESHCFRVEARTKDGRALLGLAFTPQDDRREERVSVGREGGLRVTLGLASSGLLDPRGADVEGVLWVDRDTGHLESLDYEYVGIALPEESPRAGGYARFERLPDGAWVVRRWWLRMPTLQVAGRGGLELMGVREEGGELLRVRGRAGAPVALAAGASLTGRVLVERSAEPVAAATVLLSGTPLAAATDGAGRFRLDGVVPGPQLVAAHHPLLDSLGLPLPVRSVEVGGVFAAPVVSFPDRARVLDYLCPRLAAGDGHLLAVVDPLPEEGQPVRVTVEAMRSGSRLGQMTDEQGRARFCRVPGDQPLQVRAAWPDGATAAAQTTLVGRLGLVLLRPDPSAEPGPAR